MVVGLLLERINKFLKFLGMKTVVLYFKHYAAHCCKMCQNNGWVDEVNKVVKLI